MRCKLLSWFESKKNDEVAYDDMPPWLNELPTKQSNSVVTIHGLIIHANIMTHIIIR